MKKSQSPQFVPQRVWADKLFIDTLKTRKTYSPIAGINGVFLLWLKRDMKESPADIAKMIVNLLDSHAFNRDT